MKNDKTIHEMENQLRREAQATPEAFNEALHGRILRQVRQTRLHAGQPLPLARYALIGLSAAAVVLIGVMLGLHFLSSGNSPITPLPPQIARGDIAQVHSILRDVSMPVRDEWHNEFHQAIPNSALADLNADAQSFSRFLARQFDQLPHGTPEGTVIQK